MPSKAPPSGPSTSRTRPATLTPPRAATPASTRARAALSSLPPAGQPVMITTNDTQSVSSIPADAAQDAGKVAEASGASIDKVRDILFGSQMREVDRRLDSLDECLTMENVAMT